MLLIHVGVTESEGGCSGNVAARKLRPNLNLRIKRGNILQAYKSSLAAMPLNMSLFCVNAILILAVDDSSRILAKCDCDCPRSQYICIN